MSVSYKISDQAYLKLILHALKYPHRPVNGVLLGRLTASGTVLIEDAVPLLHNWTSLSPMLEIGLDVARTHAESIDLSLVGYYQATDDIKNENPLVPIGDRIASTIQQTFAQAIAIVVYDSDRDDDSVPPVGLTPFFPVQAKQPWKSSKDSFIAFASPDIPFRAIKLRQPEQFELVSQFHDFDDHLGNVSLNWLKNDACLSNVQRFLSEAS